MHGLSVTELDRAFAAELTTGMESRAQGPVVITRHPENLTVLKGQSLEITFKAAGPAYFQWIRNDTPIPGATLP